MEIKIKIGKKVFSLCIGNETPWFKQIPFVTVVEEMYNDELEVVYANLIWKS